MSNHYYFLKHFTPSFASLNGQLRMLALPPLFLTDMFVFFIKERISFIKDACRVTLCLCLLEGGCVLGSGSVSFRTENHQRRVLQTVSTGRGRGPAVWRDANSVSAVPRQWVHNEIWHFLNTCALSPPLALSLLCYLIVFCVSSLITKFISFSFLSLCLSCKRACDIPTMTSCWGSKNYTSHIN